MSNLTIIKIKFIIFQRDSFPLSITHVNILYTVTNQAFLALFRAKLSLFDQAHRLPYTSHPKLAQLVPNLLADRVNMFKTAKVRAADLPSEPCETVTNSRPSYALIYEQVRVLCRSELPIMTLDKLCRISRTYPDIDPHYITACILNAGQKHPGTALSNIIITSLPPAELTPLNRTLGYLVHLEMILTNSLRLQGSQEIRVRANITPPQLLHLELIFQNPVAIASLPLAGFLHEHEIPFAISQAPKHALCIDATEEGVRQKLYDLFHEQQRPELVVLPSQAAACQFFQQIDATQKRLILNKLATATGKRWRISKGREHSIAFIQLDCNEDLSNLLPENLQVKHMKHATDGSRYLQITLNAQNLRVLNTMPTAACDHSLHSPARVTGHNAI